MLVMIGANGPQVYNTIFCTCVCMKASTIKKKVWRHHDLMEKGMEENPLLCSLCSGHEHWNKVILKEYWYCDLHVKMKVAQSCPILCNPMDCIVHGIPQAGILEWVALLQDPSPRDLPNPGIEPRSLTLQANSLPAEPPEAIRNTNLVFFESSYNHWVS